MFPEKKFREFVGLLLMDLSAVRINKQTVWNAICFNRCLYLFKDHMVERCKLDSPFPGKDELDENYFGARRIKGERSRGAYGKTIISGLLKRAQAKSIGRRFQMRKQLR